MTKIMSRIIARPTGVKSLVLFGLLGLFACSAMADTSYSVTLANTGLFTLPSSDGTGNPTGNNAFPGAGACFGLIGSTGTLTLLSGGGLTLTIGGGAIGTATGCGVVTSGVNPVLGTTHGVYSTISAGFWNGLSTNGPTEAGSAGFTFSNAGSTYFVVADDFPPPGSCSTNCTNGGSLDFLLKINNTSSVPEPSSASTGLIGFGLLGLGMLVRRRIATR